MRAVFVTSGLAPGRDGVGDYARRVAGELAKRGHTVALVGLADGEEGESGGELRLDRKRAWVERVERARRFLKGFGADAAAWQFVAYGYDPKGMAGGLAEGFGRLFGGVPTHVFFHELWVGGNAEATFAERVRGWFQKRGTLRALRAVGPRSVTTSNPAYRGALRAEGLDAGMVPLAPAFPVRELAPKRDGAMTVGFFGTLHPEWTPVIGVLERAYPGLRVEHAGGMGAGEGLWEAMRKAHAGVDWVRHGQLDEAGLARVFSGWDAAITTTPWQLAGKSSSARTLLDHGLPVLVTRDDVHYPGWVEEEYDEGLIFACEDPAGALGRARRRAARDTGAAVAAAWERILQEGAA